MFTIALCAFIAIFLLFITTLIGLVEGRSGYIGDSSLIPPVLMIGVVIILLTLLVGCYNGDLSVIIGG